MAGTLTYTVKKGDTLQSLGIPAEILRLNPGLKSLKVGQTIKIPIGKTGAGLTPGMGAPGVGTGYTPPPPGYNQPPRPGGTPTPPPPRPPSGRPNGRPGVPPPVGDNQLGGRTMGGGSTPNMPTFNTGGGQWGTGYSPPPAGYQEHGRALPPYLPGTSGGKPYQDPNVVTQGQPGGKPVKGPNTGSGQGSSNYVDFTNPPPNMSWDEYYTRLARAQQNGYRGQWLQSDPSNYGIGVLTSGTYRPPRGNPPRSGGGYGNNDNKGGPNGQPAQNPQISALMQSILQSNPALAQNQNFMQVLNLLGGLIGGGTPTGTIGGGNIFGNGNTAGGGTVGGGVGNNGQAGTPTSDPWQQILQLLQGLAGGGQFAGGNNAVSGDMNWRF